MTEFQKKLKGKMNEFVHFVYHVTKSFPREELFGVTSQFRRAALSVILNYIEGFARIKHLVQLNFLETSYGSLREADYLLDFSFKERFLDENNCKMGKALTDEIGAMLWTEIEALRKSLA